MKRVIVISLLLILGLLTGCDYFEAESSGDASDIEIVINNIQPLPDSLTYAGWVEIQDGTKDILVSTIEPSAGTTTAVLRVPVKFTTIHSAQSFKVTIEKKATMDSANAGNSVLMSGKFQSNICEMKYIVSDDTTVAAGAFNLATPTDGPGTNELSGIWFADSLDRANGPKSTLALPVLQSGWIFEGWVLINGTYVSTGQFSKASGPDLSNKYSDTAFDPYNFPGEDFLLNAPQGLTFPTDLSGSIVIVTIEPNIKKGGTPFLFKILEGTVPAGASDRVRYDLQGSQLLIPSGSAKIILL